MLRLRVAAALLVLGALTPAVALATVSTTTHTVTYTGSGGSTFTITFPFLAASHIVVHKTTIATNTSVLLTQGVDYTVTLPVGSTSGYITTTATVSSSYRITIDRTVPLTQLTSFRTQGAYSAARHEEAFDKLTMIVQALSDGSLVASDIQAAIDAHSSASDPHTGYALLAGRSGGQTLIGGTAAGNNLALKTTSHSTKAKILMGSSGTELVVDDVNDRVGIGTASPTTELDVHGEVVAAANTTNAAGGTFTGNGTGTGVYGAGGGTDGAFGVYGIGTGAGQGVTGVGGATGYGVYGQGGASGAAGVVGAGTVNNVGVNGQGNGSGAGIEGDGGATGYGGIMNADTTSPARAALRLVPQDTDPSSPTQGDIYVNSGDGTLRHYTTAWKSVADRLGPNLVTTAGLYTIVAPRDCGGVVRTSTDSAVVTLPDAAGSNFGCKITLQNTGADGAALISLAPDVSDGIYGSCVGVTGAGAATVVQFSGTANKPVNNTKATANKGDYITVQSDGSGGWYTVGCVGEWASTP